VLSGSQRIAGAHSLYGRKADHGVRAMPIKVKGDNKIKAGLVPQEKL
jgi:hypothetical protein